MFLTADTHFGYKNTLDYRPFDTIEDMDNTIKANWNNLISKDNLVIHLGDFGEYKQIQELNGKVILILGNHDIDYMNMYFDGNYKDFESHLLSLGFYKILDHKLNIKDMTLTHNPINCDTRKFNVFGHLHKLQMFNKFGINIGVDLFNYSPISMETLTKYRTIHSKFKTEYSVLI